MRGISEKNTKLLYSIGTVILVLLTLFLVLTKLLGFLAPFLIALLITLFIEKPVRFLQKKLKLPRGISVAIIMFLFVVVTGALLVLIFQQLLMEVWKLTKDSPSLQNLLNYIKQLVEHSENWYYNLPEEIVSKIQTNLQSSLGDILNKVSSSLTGWINKLLDIMLGILQYLPQLLLYIIITLVSAFFMSKDREKISDFIFGQLPHGWESKVRSIKGDLLLAMVGYIKAQLILVSISFVIVLIGYNIIGVEYAFFLAIITGIFDLLPIFGPGTILLPGAAMHLMAGNTGMALGYIILYLVVLLTRQFLEPRIVGGNIGLHPLATLLFIYLGFRIFGVVGIVLGPIFAIIIKALQKAKVLPQWKPT